MAYIIHKSDGTAVTVADNSVDVSYYNPTGGGGVISSQGMGTQLIGRNTIDYGAAVAQNFLQLTENFSSSTMPVDTKALQGQLWFNRTNGTSGELYVRVSGATSGGMANWQQIVTGSLAEPATQIVYGSGTGITSNSDFTFDGSTYTLSIGSVSLPTSIEAGIGQLITVSGDAGSRLKSNTNTFGINSAGAVLINSAAGTSGQVLTSAGAGSPSSWTTISPGGGGSVTSVATGSGLTGGPITTTGTISVDSTVIRTTGTQTMTGHKEFTGGVQSLAYNLTFQGNSIFYAGPTTSPAADEPTVFIATNEPLSSAPYDAVSRFYNQRFACDGSSTILYPFSSNPQGAVILGIDNNISPGPVDAAVSGRQKGPAGIGVDAYAENASYTGSVIVTRALRPPSGLYTHISCVQGANLVFRVSGVGNVTADGTFVGGGADYAEYFEWADGNLANEDRVGYCVSLVSEKIKIADIGETVLGVVSATPTLSGDSAELSWKDMYLRDDWGRVITEPYVTYNWTTENEYSPPTPHSVASYDDISNVPVDATVLTVDANGDLLSRPVINPLYNPALEYIPRSKRPEWSPVGLLGKLRIRPGQVTGANWIKLRDISPSIEEWLVK